MAAPKGNKYYMNRTKDGRELIYSTPEELLEKAYSYFIWCDKTPLKRSEVLKGGVKAGKVVKISLDRPYTLVGMCNYLGISKRTFDNYEERKDYLPITTYIRDIIQQNQIEGAVVGNYNANIVARLLGLVDKQEVESTGGITINVASSKTKEGLERLQSRLQKE